MWPVKVPARLTSDVDSRRLDNVDPIITQLVTKKLSMLKEIQTGYSLEDAFTMFDVVTVAALNKALSVEATVKVAKSSRRK